MTRSDAFVVSLLTVNTCVSTFGRKVELTTSFRSATSCGNSLALVVAAKLLNWTSTLEAALGRSLVVVTCVRVGLVVLVCKFVCSVEMLACTEQADNVASGPHTKLYAIRNVGTPTAPDLRHAKTRLFLPQQLQG